MESNSLDFYMNTESSSMPLLRRSPRLRTDVNVSVGIFPPTSSSSSSSSNNHGNHNHNHHAAEASPVVKKAFMPPMIDIGNVMGLGLQHDTFGFDPSMTPSLTSPQLSQWLDNSPRGFTPATV
jgi:hypothetical protein